MTPLDILRANAELPHHGKPDRFEVSFDCESIKRANTSAKFYDWWRNEVHPVIMNMTGERGYVTRDSVYTTTEQEALLIAMMFRPYVTGVLDWDDIKWVTLPPRSGSMPPL